MKVAILYPWADVLKRRTGASLRAGYLIDYLKREHDEVVVLSVGTREPVHVDGVEYRFTRPPEQAVRERLGLRGTLRGGAPAFRARFSKGAAWRMSSRRLTRSEALARRLRLYSDPVEVQAVDFFLASRFDPGLRRDVEYVLDGVDRAFIEYPFWGRVALPVCRRLGVPSVMTAYDVLSKTFGATQHVRRFLEAEEVWAMRHADRAVCVSEEDRAFFAERGVEAGLIPNPVDAGSCHLDAREDAVAAFRAGREIPPGPVCLFMGSRHPPNMEAAAVVEQLARSVPDVTFVIAGTCTPPGRERNLVKLGEVTDEERALLYSLADLVTIPLRRGTGSSLKLIESLAHGKAVLTTAVGARGYPVEDGVHAVVSDHLEAYPALVRSLVANHARRAEVEANACEFGSRYDYRVAYEPYSQILGVA